MKVIIFGATGMVGQGVLRECLLDPAVELVLSVGRAAAPQQDVKLRTLVHPDLFDLGRFESQLTGFDACFFCLGVSSFGMAETAYRHLTYDLTIAVAQRLAWLNPQMSFIYVSGAGTDSTEKGRTMWARVKGATENALMRLPFRSAYMFRPGAIVPLHGVTSKTPLYRFAYAALRPAWRPLQAIFPSAITTTEQIGRAMLHAAKSGAPKPILESADINKL
jgi:uncharacterized protein YbjT (DUF2867 family)